MGEKSYQFIYFYYKDGKRIPLLTRASRDLNNVLFTPQKNPYSKISLLRTDCLCG